MAKLAFCGLGQMGLPMATRLVEAGHDVTVWNRTREKAGSVVRVGATLAETPREAARGAEAALTMLADPSALEQVLFGEDGLASGMAAGATLIEMSTVGPTVVAEVRGRLSDDVEMLDAPVLGTIPAAEDGSLEVFVGGSEEAFRRWSAVLEAVGTTQRIGSLGAGAAMKLTVNACLMALMTALGEALALADGLGLRQETVLSVLSDSPIGVSARSKRGRIESGEYPPNFKLSLARKDAALVVEEAERTGVSLSVARAALSWMEAAEEAGFGELDYSAVIARIRGTEARAGAPARTA